MSDRIKNWQEYNNEPWKAWLRCPVSFGAEVYISLHGEMTDQGINKLIKILKLIKKGYKVTS
jgi:hypothetical protein